MSATITGTNTEKVDQLTQQFVELRTMVRVVTGITAVSFPLLVGLMAFLVVKVIDSSVRIEQISSQMSAISDIQRDQAETRERLIRIEAKLTDRNN